jgi:hypothetical protein
VLNHRPSGDVSEWLTRKSGCGVTGGDDDDDGRRFRRSPERIWERDRGHGES